MKTAILGLGGLTAVLVSTSHGHADLEARAKDQSVDYVYSSSVPEEIQQTLAFVPEVAEKFQDFASAAKTPLKLIELSLTGRENSYTAECIYTFRLRFTTASRADLVSSSEPVQVDSYAFAPGPCWPKTVARAR